MKRFSILYDLGDSAETHEDVIGLDTLDMPKDKDENLSSINTKSNYNFHNVIEDLNLREVSKYTSLPPEDIEYVMRVMTGFKTTKKDINVRQGVLNDFLRLNGFYELFEKRMTYFNEIREKLISAKRNMLRVHADVSDSSNAFLNYNRITSACHFFTLTYNTIFSLYKEIRDIDIKSPHFLKFAGFLTDLVENTAFKKLNEECRIFNDHVNEGVIFDIEMKLNSILRIISLRLYDFRFVKPVQTGLFYTVMRALSIEEKREKNKFIYIEKTFTQSGKISSVDDAYLKAGIEYQINLAARRLAAIYEGLIDLFMNISGELIFYNYALRMISYMRKTGVPYCFAEVSEVGKNTEAANVENSIYFEDLCDITLSNRLQESEISVIRNDFALTEKDGVNIIIGANQSGKTTFLRAFGSALMFARTGLPVPAASAKITLFKNLYTHFQRYDAEIKNEGQLDTELDEMENIVYSIDKESLLLMNESFSSTGIKDATQIAVDVLSALSHLETKSVFVTHIQNLYDKVIESETISRERGINLFKTGQNADGTPTYKLEKLKNHEK